MPLAVDLIADIVTQPRLRSDRDRGGTRRHPAGDRAGPPDTPDDIIFDWLQEEAFPEQPLGRTILGPAERVRGFARGDFDRFVAEHYGPGELILSAAGGVDPAEILRLAEAAFGHLEATPAGAARAGHIRGAAKGA